MKHEAQKAVALLDYYDSAQKAGQIIGTHPGALPDSTRTVCDNLNAALVSYDDFAEALLAITTIRDEAPMPLQQAKSIAENALAAAKGASK